MTFTLTLTNAVLYSDATGVVVRDVLPGGYSFVSAAGDGSYDDATGQWSLAGLAAGAGAALDITATVPLGAPDYAEPVAAP